MRAPILIAACLALGGTTVACGLLTGVEWDRVAVHDGGSGGTSGASGTSGTSGASGTSGTSGTSGVPSGECSGEQVECLTADGVKCCPNGGEPGLPVTLAAGGQNTCAIATSGQVKCWGANGLGQLGRGTQTSPQGSNTPLIVFRIPKGATQITVGGSHVCAIVDSLFTCWGANSQGQFGNGSTDGSPLPIVISLPAAADSIGAGLATTCASLGGSGFCWGDNTASQGGNEIDKTRIIVPTPVKALPNLAGTGRAITAGHQHSCASTGTNLYCWGTNTLNRLGVGGLSQSAAAVVVLNGIGPASDIVLGDNHGCALQATGAVECWGSNVYGELGNDSVQIQSVGAVNPTGLGPGLSPPVTSLCAGMGHTCVVQGGVVKCFGDNSQGQSGIGPGGARIRTPVQGMAGFTAKQVVCGSYHTCALSDAGAIKCWGTNQSGERGDGTTDGNTSTPRDVKW